MMDNSTIKLSLYKHTEATSSIPWLNEDTASPWLLHTPLDNQTDHLTFGDQTSNLTYYEEYHVFFIFEKAKFDGFEIALVVVGILAMVINAFLLYIFTRWIKQKTASMLLLASLSVNDLFAACIVIPLHLIVSLQLVVPQGKNMIVYTCATAANAFSMYSTIFNLSCVSFDRYLLICHVMKSRTWITKRAVKRTIVLIWGGALVMTAIPFMWGYERITTADTVFDIFSLVLYLILPLIQITVAFPRMIYAMYRWNHRVKTSCRQRRLEFKASVLFLCMYIFFVASWSPIHIIRVMIDLSYNFKNLTASHLEILVVVRYISAITNPTIYTLRIQGFTAAVKKCTSYYLRTKKESSTTNSVLTTKVSRSFVTTNRSSISLPTLNTEAKLNSGNTTLINQL